MFAPQTNPASPAVLCVEIQYERISLRFLIQGMRIPLPRPLFPVYRFFFPVAVFANFGVRVYVSIVTGGSLTTKIIPNAKPSSTALKDGVSTHNFR